MKNSRQHSRSRPATGAKSVSRRARGNVRARILSVATQLFATRGFDGTSLQEVADRVGVRKPSVLHHFSSKEALRAAVTRQVLEHWSQAIPSALRAAGTGPARFEALSREIVNFLTEHPARARLLLREALDHAEEYRRFFASDILPLLALISDSVLEGQRRGVYRPEVDPEMYLVNLVQCAIVSVAIGNTPSGPAGGGPRAKLDRATRELVRMARDSLLRPEAGANSGGREVTTRTASEKAAPAAARRGRAA
jgi:TetR/AcrR family transcriptional regulator